MACAVTESSSKHLSTIKFKLFDESWFGICFSKQSKGLIGYHDNNGWLLDATGSRYTEDRNFRTFDTGLGRMGNGGVVEMTYDGTAKSLRISCARK